MVNLKTSQNNNMETNLLNPSDDISETENWTMTIRPQRHWYDFQFGELWKYRDLIRLFVWRDFVAYYKQTILGPLWYLIQPILSTIIFTVVFGNIAKLSTDGMPAFLFYLAGQTLWSYFANCFTSTSNTFVNNSQVFGKVYFPRLSVPISIVLSNLISFAIRFGLFIIVWVYYLLTQNNIHPNLWAFSLPLLVLLMGGMGLGFGIIFSSLTTKYRDLQQLISFGVQLLMYAAPVIYPLSSVSGKWHTILMANPMTPVVEVFRLGFMGTSSLNPIWLLYTAGFTVVTLFIGLALFNRVEASFMDTV